jgi:hypothetical protein
LITLAKLLRHHLQSHHVAVDTNLNYNLSMLIVLVKIAISAQLRVETRMMRFGMR